MARASGALTMSRILRHSNESSGVTKIPQELKNLPYEDRLKRLNLTTLKIKSNHALNLTTLREQRIRGDLIETFKITSGYYGCNLEIFHLPNAGNLRGHNRKLSKERCNKLLRKKFLNQQSGL